MDRSESKWTSPFRSPDEDGLRHVAYDNDLLPVDLGHHQEGSLGWVSRVRTGQGTSRSLLTSSPDPKSGLYRLSRAQVGSRR